MFTIFVFIFALLLGVVLFAGSLAHFAKKGYLAMVIYQNPKKGKRGKYTILGQIATLTARMEAAKQQQRAGNALADEVEYL